MVNVADASEVNELACKVARLEMQVRCLSRSLQDFSGALRDELYELISDRDMFPGVLSYDNKGRRSVVVEVLTPDIARVHVTVSARCFKEAVVRMHVQSCFDRSLVRIVVGDGVVLDRIVIEDEDKK